MRFSLLIHAVAAALIAGAAQATPNPAAPAVSPTPPSAAPIVYCPQVIVPPACRGVTSGGGGGTVVGHGHRVVTTTRYSRRTGAGAAHRVGGESYAYARRVGSGYGRYASGRYDVTVRTRRVRVRGGDEGRYVRVERDDYDVDNQRDGYRGEGRVRYAGPGSGPGYHDTWSGWGGRYGTGDRASSRGYGYRYSEEGSDRVIEHRRVEGFGGGYRNGESYSYSYRSPPQVDVYERYGYRGEDRRSPPPGADRYGDRYDRHDDGDRDDRARGHGHDFDDRDGDDDGKGRGGDAGDHHRYAGGDDRDHDGRGHGGHGHDGGMMGHHDAYADGGRGHQEVYVYRHDGGAYDGRGYAYDGMSGMGHHGYAQGGYAYGGGYAGGGYASSSSSYSSASSHSSHGYTAYGARFYSGGCQQCQAPLRGNGYYAFSQDEDGALTWQNRDDDQ